MATKGGSSCVFCEIVSGQVPSFKVFEDQASVAFLDHRPLFPGHCLLVSKVHYDTFLDLPVDLVAPIFTNAQRLTRAVERAMQAEGSLIAINNRVSQSVPHFHMHIVPRRKKDGLRGFFWPRQSYTSQDAMLQAQAAIQAAVRELR